ncbi:MAG: glycosyltransferase family 2 protein [Planctomycetota bacterium]
MSTSDGVALLSVVLPCRNQADHIAAVLERYRAPLEGRGRPYELVVVPNACTDRTADVVRALAQRWEAVRVIESQRGGWGLAVKLGLAAARGTTLCYTNSARTDPLQLVRLLETYESRQPCLAKVRRVRRGVLARELGSWLYNLEGRTLLGIGARDVNGTPKILSRDVWQRVQLTEEGDLIDMELLAKVSRLGLPVVELEVEGFTRHGGRSSTNLRSALNMYLGALRLRRQLKNFTAAA